MSEFTPKGPYTTDEGAEALRDLRALPAPRRAEALANLLNMAYRRGAKELLEQQAFDAAALRDEVDDGF